MKKCTLICDLAYGSTGKGLIAGYLAEENEPDTVITAWAPNAGHTYIDKRGREFIHTMLANGVVSPKLKQIMIGPGSVVNFKSLLIELKSCRDLVKNASLFIHPNACVVTQKDRDAEKVHNRIGSTQKGSGAVVIRRVMRDVGDDPRVCEGRHGMYLRDLRDILPVHTGREDYLIALRRAKVVQIEGAQGFGLSIYHGFWPYTTSRDCSPAQICADTGVAIQDVTRVVGCLRTYPIRVSNRHDKEGNQVGYSGPCYDDQEEITFESIGQKTELTTVTKLPRRIFTFSEKQLREAIQVCRPDALLVNFLNYLGDEEAVDFLQMIKTHHKGHIYTGWGPTSADIVPF